MMMILKNSNNNNNTNNISCCCNNVFIKRIFLCVNLEICESPCANLLKFVSLPFAVTILPLDLANLRNPF